MSTPRNADLIAESEQMGVSHLVNLTIVAGGREIKSYKSFELTQSTGTHHRFTLVLNHDSLGVPENHEMEQAKKLLGKRILVSFSYRNVPTGPEREFIGTITNVGLSRSFRNHGNIVLSGHSPTILLDGRPGIQSFGGSLAISLNTIADTIFKQALGGDYNTSANAKYGNVAYSSQYCETHYNYLARLAETYGEQFYYDGKTIHFGQLPTPEKEIALDFGKNVDHLDIQMNVVHVNPRFYGYSSSEHQLLTTGPSNIRQVSSLAQSAYEISKKTFIAPAYAVAPLKAKNSKDIDAAQDGAAGSAAVDTFTVTGRTSVPFLYPGCVAAIQTITPETNEIAYVTRVMITKIKHTTDTLGNYTGEFEAIGADTGYLPKPEFVVVRAEPQVAHVIDNRDPENLGRIKVAFEWQAEGETTEWLRVLTPDAGGSEKVSKNRGLVAIPEMGDQTMVGFIHGHPDRPYVTGSLFHGKIASGGGPGNNIKSFSSKSGHSVELNDAGGITIKDKTGEDLILIDGQDTIAIVATKNITLTNKKSSIILDEENISMEAKNISINGSDIVAIGSGGANVSVTSKGDVAAISGKKVVASGSTNVQVEGQQTAISATKLSMDGSAETTVTGGIVKINS